MPTLCLLCAYFVPTLCLVDFVPSSTTKIKPRFRRLHDHGIWSHRRRISSPFLVLLEVVLECIYSLTLMEYRYAEKIAVGEEFAIIWRVFTSKILRRAAREERIKPRL